MTVHDREESRTSTQLRSVDREVSGMLRRREFLASAGIAALSGCVAPTKGCQGTEFSDLPAPTGKPYTADVDITVLVDHLEIPWDLAFAPTGDLFITERTGRILRLADSTLTTVTRPTDVVDARAIPPGSEKKGWWITGGADGMHGVAVHPNYPSPAYVFAYYTYSDENGAQFNKLVRYDTTVDDPTTTATVLVDRIPGGNYHNGGRIAIGPDDHLWVTTGDAGQGELAQDTSSLAGKILRLDLDGTPARDNPVLPGPNPDSRIYTFGHRNPQGLTWLPDGTAINTEHGPVGHGEVNVLRPGGNYGWPIAWNAEQYRAHPAFAPPVLNSGRDTWAPSGCVFYTGELIPEWQNRLLIGTLRDQELKVVTLSPCGGTPLFSSLRRGDYYDADWLDQSFSASAHRMLSQQLGRVRHVTQAPDGSVYALTSNRDGRARAPFPKPRDDVLVRIA